VARCSGGCLHAQRAGRTAPTAAGRPPGR
jgi:hypothetical protein